jgi:hypothetical protein
METVKYKAKGVLLRHFKSMGTNATEPFKPIEADSREALFNHVNTLMVDNIKAVGVIVKTVSKTEIEDENFVNEAEDFVCVGNLTEKECANLLALCLQVK